MLLSKDVILYDSQLMRDKSWCHHSLTLLGITVATADNAARCVFFQTVRKKIAFFTLTLTLKIGSDLY